MYGAFIGDIVGSKYEFNNIKTKEFPLFSTGCDFTDDSIMTVAVAQAILLSRTEQSLHRNRQFQQILVEVMQDFGKRYPNPTGAYGGHFGEWLEQEDPRPYGSYGNGSAMRVSPCGLAAITLAEAQALARASAAVTHNHPEGIKGAEAVASAIFLAKTGETKESIRNYIEEHYYKLDFTLDSIRGSYAFDSSCQGTVPQAIAAFLESNSFEDSIRNAISIGGDSDTIGAITGSIAWTYYAIKTSGYIGWITNELDPAMQQIRDRAIDYLPAEFVELADAFHEQCWKRADTYERIGGCTSILSAAETMQYETQWGVQPIQPQAAGQGGAARFAETKRCPNCGKEIPAESVFCLSCGTRIVEEPEPATAAIVEEPPLAPAPQPESEPEAQPEPDEEPISVLQCPKCGEALEPDSVFCPYCGTRIPEAETPSAPLQPSPSDLERLSAARERIAPAAGLISACGSIALAASVSGEVYRLEQPNALEALDGRRWKVRELCVGLKHSALVLADGGILLAPHGSPMEDLGWHSMRVPVQYKNAVCTEQTVYGLMTDGTVARFMQKGPNLSGWKEVRAIAAGNTLVVGLLRNGIVRASDEAYQPILSQWNDIVSVTVVGEVVYGVRSDGTVLTAGPTAGKKSPVIAGGIGQYGERDVSEWTQIVAVAASGWHTVGLRADGTVCAVGGLKTAEVQVTGWTDVVAVAAGAGFTLGLRSDGNVLFAGENSNFRNAVQSWRLFKDLDTLEQERTAAQADIPDLSSWQEGSAPQKNLQKGAYGGYPLLDQKPESPKCPHCGEPLAADAAFCAYCGKKVTDPVDDSEKGQNLGDALKNADMGDVFAAFFGGAAKTQTATAPDQNKCPHCGEPLRKDAAFCVYCGKKVTDPVADGEKGQNLGDAPKNAEMGDVFAAFFGGAAKTQTGAAPDLNKCPHCGETLKKDAAFCVYCGKKPTDPVVNGTKQSGNPTKSTGGSTGGSTGQSGSASRVGNAAESVKQAAGGLFGKLKETIQSAKDTRALHNERRAKAENEILYQFSQSSRVTGYVEHIRENCPWAYKPQGPYKTDDTRRYVTVKPEGVHICRKANRTQRVREGDRIVERTRYVPVDELGVGFEISGVSELRSHTSDVTLDDRTGQKVVISTNRMCELYATALKDEMARAFPDCRFDSGTTGAEFSYNTPDWSVVRDY